ncbi:MAG: HD domain-containing protein [Lachnospiraceae bacterium]|nr:HD domain-containing protein [Lachnospiraceae bacterium]
MRLVTVEDLKNGDVIASDVLLDDYTVVVAKGTVIKEQYIRKLEELEIYTVYIEEEAEAAAPPPEKEEKKPKSVAKPEEKKPEKKAEKKKAEPKKTDKKRQKLSMEVVTVLRDDVEEQIRQNIKDILELHVYQTTEGLQKITETAQNIITDILEEDEVVEKVYDVKERSADIYEHSLQVCTIATLIALKLGLSEKQVYDISVSSLIHDLGLRYLVVRYEDQDINLLPARDQEEYKKHPIYGYTAIKNEDWLSEEAKDIVLNHHERKDGSGYPLGTDIVSRMTQIVGVCDEFDELICGVGKARVRVHEAINNIRNYGGIWYDSDIVDTFLQLIAVYPAGSKVKTNEGEKGIVLRQNAHFPERPVLRITHDRFGQVIQGEKVIDLIKNTRVVIQEVIK